jgi:uncharacterized SAM-binding protein YcdF (DUF218 family)
VAVVVLATAVLVRLFVVPPADGPRAADLVVVIGGLETRARQHRAEQLVAEHPGAVVLVSVAQFRYCPDVPPGAAGLECYHPQPFTTRGEARGAADFARAHDLRSMVVVTTADQVVRARLRFSRCWSGPLAVVQAPAPLLGVLAHVPYQSAAMVKALVLERGC